MQQLGLGALFPAEAYLGAARLEVLKVGAGAYLHIPAVAGHPYLYVVGLGAGEAQIACGEHYYMIGQAEALQHLLGVPGQGLQLVVAVLGLCELNKLHLVELMLADKPAGIAACGAGFAAEAGAVCAILDGQLIAVHYLPPQHVGDGNLGGGDKKVIGIGYLEGVLLEFGKLAGAGHGGPVYHIGRKYLGIAVGGMGIQIVVDYGALQAGAQAPVYREAGAGDLACGGEIQYAQIFTYVPMRLGLEVELRGL